MRRYGLYAILLMALNFTSRTSAEEPPAKKFQVFTPKDDRINAVDINERGEVVGTEWVEDKENSDIIGEAPFLTQGRTMTSIPILEGYTSIFPAAVSDGGIVVGRSSKPGSPTRRVMLRNQAFIWDAKSGIRGLGALEGDVSSIACGISRDGTTISGYSVGDNRIRVCVWDRVGDAWAGTPLPQKDRLGSIVVAISGDGRHVSAVDGNIPCLWSREASGEWTRQAIGGPGELIPRAVNNSATVVGYKFVDNRKQAVIWTRSGGLKSIEKPPGCVQSEANDVNNDGIVVGTIENDNGAGKELEPRAFIYVNNRLQPIDGGGPNFIAANAINDLWQITGTFERDDEEVK